MALRSSLGHVSCGVLAQTLQAGTQGRRFTSSSGWVGRRETEGRDVLLGEFQQNLHIGRY